MDIPVSGNDSYPPGEVTDLSLVLVNDTVTNISIALKWTAPGDELDSGTGIIISQLNSYILNKIYLHFLFQFPTTNLNIRMSSLM